MIMQDTRDGGVRTGNVSVYENDGNLYQAEDLT